MAIPQKKTHLLSIIIVNYNTDEMTLDLIRSLGRDKDSEIIVVDNSTSNTIERKLFADVRYIFAGKNLGFAAGNNLGIKQATGEWIFLLNSDTVTTIGEIKKLILYAQKNKSLVVAPKLISKDRTVQDTVGYFDNFLVSPINYVFARPRFINCNSTEKSKVVNFATGAALLAHSSIFQKIGLLDELFFMYMEDIDFSYELHKKGIQITYIPQVKIVHYGGATSDKDPKQKDTNYLSSLDYYLHKRRGFVIAWLNRISKVFK